MSELSAAFEGLDDAFDTEFDEDTLFKNSVPEDDTTTAVAIRGDASLVPISNDDKVIRETEFVAKEIKGLISSSKDVLDRLDCDIKIGSAPRMYEVYSQLANSITSQLKELRQMHESVAKIKIDQGKMKLEEVGDNDKISLTSDQLLDMLDNAQKRSQMNKIDADFVIDEEDMLPSKDDEYDDDGE